MLGRREFIAASAGAMLLPAAAAKAQSCAQTCVVQVDLDRPFFSLQTQPEWCWSACISMIFAYHGHPVSQDRIVTEAYGGAVNIPAMPITMSSALSREWTDDNGDNFSSRLIAAYDQFAGVVAINNDTIVQSLANNDPIIVGARHHAILMTAAEYLPTPSGTQIVNVGVFDPWPGLGTRALAPDELVPAFRGGSLYYLASVEVDA